MFSTHSFRVQATGDWVIAKVVEIPVSAGDYWRIEQVAKRIGKTVEQFFKDAAAEYYHQQKRKLVKGSELLAVVY